MLNARPYFFFLFLLCVYSSCKNTEQPSAPSFSDQLPTFSTPGKVIASDSLLPPRLFKMKELKGIDSGPAHVISINKKPHLLKDIGKATALKTISKIPGKDGCEFPKAFSVSSNVIKAGKPDKILLKDPEIIWESDKYIKNYSEAQGLRPGRIMDILEDKVGQLWMCSNLTGIIRFDGKHAYSYSEKQGLEGNGAVEILQNEKHEFWIATNLGLSNFDGINFHNYIFESSNHNDNAITSLAEDKNGDLWIASRDGLYLMDSQNRTCIKFDVTSGLKENAIRHVTSDSKGRIWIVYYSQGISLLQLTDDDNFPYSFIHFQDDRGILSAEFADVHEDQDKNIWLATTDGALILSETIVKDDNIFTLTKLNHENGLPQGRVISIEQDNLTKEIYLSIENKGVSILAKERNTFSHRSLAMPKTALYGYLYADSHNKIWAGTGKGFMRISHNQFNLLDFKDESGSYNPTRVTEDKWGRTWFGSYGQGVFLYEPETNVKEAKLYQFTTANGMSSNVVDDIKGDKKGNLWIGLRDYGLIKMELDENDISGTFTNYYEEDNFPAGLVPNMLLDSEDNLWCALYEYGAQETSGICRVRDDEILHIGINQGLINEDTWSLKQDDDGSFWVGSAQNGLTKFQYSSDSTIGQVTHFTLDENLLGLRIWSLEIDGSGNIWAGANGGEGLVEISPVTGDSSFIIKHVSESEGLIHNHIAALLEDFSGNIWVGSRGGLSNLLTSTDQGITRITNYTEFDGFPNSGVYFNGIHQSPDSTIWVKSNTGLVNFNPNHLEVIKGIPNIVLNEVLLFNEKVQWGNGTTINLKNGIEVSDFTYDSLGQWNQLPMNLILSHLNNYVSFEFNGVSVNAPHKLRYSYQLEGWSERWSAESHENVAVFGTLSPGTYIFKVKTKYQQGEWSKPVEYSFTIRPPWWRSGMAYFMYFLLVIGGLYLFVILQLRWSRWRIGQLEEIRTNISLDLHDDVGTIMSGVAMQAEYLAAAEPKDIKSEMTQISEMSREAIERMRDIVWALDPRKDKIENLIDRMHSFAEAMLGNSKFEYDFTTKDIAREKFISPELRRNIYLIFKEAVHNIHKHSNGDYVNIVFLRKRDMFSLTIFDNGRSSSKIKSDGLGISNMKLRAKKIGATLKITKKDGFTIHLEF